MATMLGVWSFGVYIEVPLFRGTTTLVLHTTGSAYPNSRLSLLTTSAYVLHCNNVSGEPACKHISAAVMGSL